MPTKYWKKGCTPRGGGTSSERADQEEEGYDAGDQSEEGDDKDVWQSGSHVSEYDSMSDWDKDLEEE
jgi:hypothetical protein